MMKTLDATLAGDAPAAVEPRCVRLANGRQITYDEAVSAKLVLRSACERCRKRKLGCVGTSKEMRGCSRCISEGCECIFCKPFALKGDLTFPDARSPVGRPRKRDGLTFVPTLPEDSSMCKPVGTAETNGVSGGELSATRRLLSDGGDFDALRAKRKRPSLLPATVNPGNGMTLSDQKQVSFAQTHQASPPVAASLPPTQSSEVQSSLADLSLAAFLESMYTLEIAPEDGLTPAMLSDTLTGSSPPHAERMADAPQNAGTGRAQMPQPCSQPSLTNNQEAATAAALPSSMYAEPATLQNDLSYSVPSDLRWWSLAWSLPESREQSGITGMQPKPAPVQSSHKHESLSPPQGNGSLCCSQSKMRVSAPPNAVSCCSGTAPQAPPDHPAPPAESDTLENQRRDGTSSDGCTHGTEKVHCVPNPDGEGCTCQCEMDVALLNLRRQMREKGPHTGTDGASQASSTLMFTLSSSQAVTRQCKCSADCPTCKKDPSAQVSASLMISTALQIYTRALHILRGVLMPDTGTTCRCPCSGNDASDASGCQCRKPRNDRCSRDADPIVDVQIGDFRPTAQNSRKIALFAMKVELHDLERAIARVCKTAESWPIQKCAEMFDGCQDAAAADVSDTKRDSTLDSSTSDASTMIMRINPIDKLVLKKLHQQLAEMLRTVEMLGLP